MKNIIEFALAIMLVISLGCGRTPEEATVELHRLGFMDKSVSASEVEKLINQGADVSDVSFSIDGNSKPITYFLYYRDSEILNLLIQNGADPNDVMIRAVAFNVELEDISNIFSISESEKVYPKKEIVQLLIDRGADVNSPLRTGNNEIFRGRVNGEEVKVLTNDFAFIEGETPLMRAASCGTPEIVRLLIDNGANVKAEDSEGNIALNYAGFNTFECNWESLKNVAGGTKRQFKLDIIKHLLNASSVDVNKGYGQTGITLLMVAADSGSLENVELLISAGAKVNAVDVNKESAMFCAIRGRSRNTTRIVRALVIAGADYNARNEAGHRPLTIAEIRGLRQTVRYLSANGALTSYDD